MQEHDPKLLREWALHVLDMQVAEGRAPSRPMPWVRATERDLARHSPAYVERAVAGIRARRTGRKITGWRETRGTHGIDYLRDPHGTDKPPWTG